MLHEVVSSYEDLSPTNCGALLPRMASVLGTLLAAGVYLRGFCEVTAMCHGEKL